MAKEIFTRGEFSDYRKTNLSEAYESVRIRDSASFSKQKTTVFISHKHDELDDVRDVIGFLEKNYNVKCYIDSEDIIMLNYTSSETATKIKNKIKQCDKFIFLATNGAIDSKWCNWDLGYGDANKFNEHIAIFPFKDSNTNYKGSEYLTIYPRVIKYNYGDKYLNGSYITPGYYIGTSQKNANLKIIELSKWFEI